jgi:hypothetical protein
MGHYSNAYSAEINPAKFNLGGGDPVPAVTCFRLRSGWSEATEDCTSLYEYKSRYLDIRRSYIFHYAVSVEDMNAHGGGIGVAEYFGNDLIFAPGSWSNGQGMSEEEFNIHVNSKRPANSS